jgi:VanZ family protein
MLFSKSLEVVILMLFRRVLWLLPLIYMAIIWIMSSLPHDTFVELPDSATDRFIKESLHLVEFAILYLLFVIVALINKQLTLTTNLVFAVIACLYGVTDEIHQYFVPARSATLIDVVKDVTGVVISFYFVRKKLKGQPR